MTLHSLGDVALVTGDAALAARRYLDSLASNVDAGQVVNCLAGLAGVAALEGLAEPAGRLWGAVESEQRRLGGATMFAQTVRRYVTALEQVAGNAFDDAVVAGHELGLEEASDEALEALGPFAATAQEGGFAGADRRTI
jgi:hypothetical protein